MQGCAGGTPPPADKRRRGRCAHAFGWREWSTDGVWERTADDIIRAAPSREMDALSRRVAALRAGRSMHPTTPLQFPAPPLLSRQSQVRALQLPGHSSVLSPIQGQHHPLPQRFPQRKKARTACAVVTGGVRLGMMMARR